jgi:hypothetical protein
MPHDDGLSALVNERIIYANWRTGEMNGFEGSKRRRGLIRGVHIWAR